jgi:putative membrane protein
MHAIAQTIRMNLSRGRLMVLGFTIAYTILAGFYFSSVGNAEFFGYVAVVTVLLVVGGCVLTHQCVPSWLLFMLSLVGLFHLLGAAIPVNGDILYNYVPFPIENPTGLTFIKFDQIFHTYGTLVAALLMYYFLRRDTSFHWLGIAVFSVLGAMGLGALNEVMEFIAKMTIPNTDVGGYYNTAVDLCVNAFGAVLGTVLAFRFWRQV